MKRLLLILIASLMFIVALPADAESYPSIFVTSQIYDRGQMIWRSDIGTIYVILNDGRVKQYPVHTYGYLPPNPFRVAPFGKVAPMMGFGKVWANYEEIRADLGWAVVNELGRNTPIVNHSNGSTYLLDQFANYVRIKPDNTWEQVSSIPTQPTNNQNPVIHSFTVSPNTVKAGDTVTVSWTITGVDAAIVEFYDAYPRNDILFAIQDRLPTSGTTIFNVPQHVLHGVTVIVYGANYDTLYNGHLVTARVIQESKTLQLETGEPANIETWAVFQQYDNGMMIWRRDIGSITVLYDDGSLSLYPLTYYAYLSDAPKDIDVPEGKIRPTNGFGRVWAYLDDVRDRLGWATGIETGYNLTITPTGDESAEYNIPPSGKLFIEPGSWHF